MLVGSAVAALLRYAFQILVARWLGVADFGIISNLFSWILTLVGFGCAGGAIAFNRFIAQREAQQQETRSTIGTGLWIQGVVFAALALIGLLFRDPLANRIFGGNEHLLFIMIGTVISQGAVVLLRGILRGFRRFGYTGVLVAGVPALRLAFSALLGLALGLGLRGVTWAILLASVPMLLPGIYWTYKMARERKNERPAPAMSARHFLDLALPATIMSGIQRFVPRSGTILLNLLVAGQMDATVGLLTAALTLARIPELVLDAMGGPLLSNLSRLEARDDRATLATYVKRTNQGVLVVIIAYTLALPWFGPRLIPLIYGGDFSFARRDMFLVTLGTAFYLGAKLYSQIILVERGAHSVARTWGLATALLIVATILLPFPPLLRTELGYLLGNGLAFVILLYQATQMVKHAQRIHIQPKEQIKETQS
jgi:O-antigen/teichoic acid export membrane protein